MIGTALAASGPILAAWVLASVPVAGVLGQVLRRSSERYPLFDPRPVYIARGGVMVRPYPLTRTELGKITNLFDPAVLVVGEPTAAGYVEIVFPDEDDAIHFVEIARDGKHGAVPVIESARTVLRVPDGGPVTLGVVLRAVWRPVPAAVAS